MQPCLLLSYLSYSISLYHHTLLLSHTILIRTIVVPCPWYWVVCMERTRAMSRVQLWWCPLFQLLHSSNIHTHNTTYTHILSYSLVDTVTLFCTLILTFIHKYKLTYLTWLITPPLFTSSTFPLLTSDEVTASWVLSVLHRTCITHYIIHMSIKKNLLLQMKYYLLHHHAYSNLETHIHRWILWS